MELTIPIRAVGKERPRWCKRYNYAYTPKRTKDFEEKIAAYAAVYMRNNQISVSETYIDFDLIVYNKVPKSWSQKKTKDALSGVIRPTKGDLDNQLKSILDGLNGVAYVDDRQVVQFRATKLYDYEDSIKIKIKEL